MVEDDRKTTLFDKSCLKRRAALYARPSGNESQNLNEEVKLLNRFAELKGYHVIGVVKDRDCPPFRIGKMASRNLLRMSKNDECDVFIVRNLDWASEGEGMTDLLTILNLGCKHVRHVENDRGEIFWEDLRAEFLGLIIVEFYNTKTGGRARLSLQPESVHCPQVERALLDAHPFTDQEIEGALGMEELFKGLRGEQGRRIELIPPEQKLKIFLEYALSKKPYQGRKRKDTILHKMALTYVYQRDKGTSKQKLSALSTSFLNDWRKHIDPTIKDKTFCKSFQRKVKEISDKRVNPNAKCDSMNLR